MSQQGGALALGRGSVGELGASLLCSTSHFHFGLQPEAANPLVERAGSHSGAGWDMRERSPDLRCGLPRGNRWTPAAPTASRRRPGRALAWASPGPRHCSGCSPGLFSVGRENFETEAFCLNVYILHHVAIQNDSTTKTQSWSQRLCARGSGVGERTCIFYNCDTYQGIWKSQRWEVIVILTDL